MFLGVKMDGEKGRGREKGNGETEISLLLAVEA